MTRGYFRFPAVFKNKVVFTSEDDLWEVPLEGGAARRLTAGRGRFSYPRFSPDGRQLAFASAEEGYNEVYVMPSEGGDLRRLTYLGATSIPVRLARCRDRPFSFDGLRSPRRRPGVMLGGRGWRTAEPFETRACVEPRAIGNGAGRSGALAFRPISLEAVPRRHRG